MTVITTIIVAIVIVIICNLIINGVYDDDDDDDDEDECYCYWTVGTYWYHHCHSLSSVMNLWNMCDGHPFLRERSPIRTVTKFTCLVGFRSYIFLDVCCNHDFFFDSGQFQGFLPSLWLAGESSTPLPESGN